MSGIAVVFNRDGSPVDPRILDRLLNAIPHRGPDGRGVWIDGPIALGHQAFATTPEARLEDLPISSARGDVRLIYDGRLDNTDEVRRELALEFDAKRRDRRRRAAVGRVRALGRRFCAPT
jgi:asparagine synthase (glutamine-hydrolysing)